MGYKIRKLQESNTACRVEFMYCCKEYVWTATRTDHGYSSDDLSEMLTLDVDPDRYVFEDEEAFDALEGYLESIADAMLAGVHDNDFLPEEASLKVYYVEYGLWSYIKAPSVIEALKLHNDEVEELDTGEVEITEMTDTNFIIATAIEKGWTLDIEGNEPMTAKAVTDLIEGSFSGVIAMEYP